MLNDLLIAFIVFLGSLLMLLAAIGILKFPDFYLRMAAISKASTLGFLLFLTAAVVAWQDFLVLFQIGTVGFFVFITTPTACHLIARAAFRQKISFYAKTSVQTDQSPQFETKKNLNL